jgi:hypothetical protein
MVSCMASYVASILASFTDDSDDFLTDQQLSAAKSQIHSACRSFIICISVLHYRFKNKYKLYSADAHNCVYKPRNVSAEGRFAASRQVGAQLRGRRFSSASARCNALIMPEAEYGGSVPG